MLAKDFSSKKAALRLCNCRLRSTKFRTEIFFSSALTVDFFTLDGERKLSAMRTSSGFPCFYSLFLFNLLRMSRQLLKVLIREKAPRQSFCRLSLFSPREIFSRKPENVVCFSRSNLISIINISARCYKLSNTTMGKCVKTRRHLELDETSQTAH